MERWRCSGRVAPTQGIFGVLLASMVQVAPIPSVVWAADTAIVLQTDKPHYDLGETVLLFGQVNGLLPQMPLILRVFSPLQHLVNMDQFSAVEDGSFIRDFVAGGPLWGSEGTYRVTVNAGTNAIAETLIGFPPPASSPRVIRILPDGYLSGRPFEVALHAVPRLGDEVYAIEDRVPLNWTVHALSHDGIFDSLQGKVKFGPFFDQQPKLFSYILMPPTTAVGIQTLEGTASFGGVNTPIGGDQSIRPIGPHPADRTPADFAMRIDEVTAYGTAWKNGNTWPEEPNPIPIAFVTRAGLLWRGGERYRIEPSVTESPLWWINDIASKAQSSAMDPIASVANRSLIVESFTAWHFEVVTTVKPAPGVSAYAIEDHAPSGWFITDISEDGVVDPINGKLKWGPFFGDRERRLRYRLAPASGTTGPEWFDGIASFNGVDVPITGHRFLTARQNLVSYQTWKSILGEAAENPALSGPYADFSQDGMANLLAYAMGLDPRIHHTSHDMFPGVREVSLGSKMAVITFPRSLSAEGIAFTVEQSENLKDWRPVNGHMQIVGEAEGALLVQVAFPWDGSAPVYCRLKLL